MGVSGLGGVGAAGRERFANFLNQSTGNQRKGFFSFVFRARTSVAFFQKFQKKIEICSKKLEISKKN